MGDLRLASYLPPWTNPLQASTPHTANSNSVPGPAPPAPAPIDAQVETLDSGMLVVGGDQATILAHLQAGGMHGAEPFAGVTLVPVDQAALAQRVLSRPSRALAPSGQSAGHASVPANSDGTAARRPARYASGERGSGPHTGDRQGHPRYTFRDDDVTTRPAPSVDRHHRIRPHRNQSLLSMHESETRMDCYDPGAPWRGGPRRACGTPGHSCGTWNRRARRACRQPGPCR